MADMPYFTFQPQGVGEPEVKVFEYMVPNSAIRPPRNVYPTAPTIPMVPVRPVSPAEMMFARWLYRRYGAR